MELPETPIIQLVTEDNLYLAAQIHADSWRESHKEFCSPDFIAEHTTQRQANYLRREMAQGKVFYLLTHVSPKGIVSVHGNLIENLYVSPSQQHKGYGTMLLHFAECLCRQTPTLWVLNRNTRACALYQRNGYRFTGNRKKLNASLEELEMKRNG